MNNNEKIIKLAKDLVPNKEIMFMYYSGSIAYGYYTETSDIDVTVVFNDYSGLLILNLEGIDFFVYGINEYIGKQNFSKEYPDYFKMHTDDTLALPKTLIYLNPKYNTEFNLYTKVDFDKNLDKYLEAFVTYFDKDEFYSLDFVTKPMQHIFRVRGMLEYYKRTGIFSLKINEPYKSGFNDYRESFLISNVSKFKDDLNESFKWIIDYLKELKNNELKWFI